MQRLDANGKCIQSKCRNSRLLALLSQIIMDARYFRQQDAGLCKF